MNGTEPDRQHPSPDTTPRLLRFTVNGKSCYALKWSDELTENRREINYVLREAASDEIKCLLVDGPLRIAGFPELVSVQSTGRTVERAGTVVWEIAVTIWADGEVDDEGMIRICVPETFSGRGQYLRDDLKRMIREYRFGTRECHVPGLPAPAKPRRVSPDSDRIEQRLDALAAAVEQAAIPKVTPSPVSASMLRQELAPVVEAVKAVGQKVTQDLDDVVPYVTADRRKAQIAWIAKTECCSEVERKAALLATEGYSLSEIAKRLPHKQGKPRTREGVRQALLRFERKTGQRGLFSKGTYRDNQRNEGEKKRDEEESGT